MGKNWHAGPGYLWVKTHSFVSGSPGSTYWEEVKLVDGAGNLTEFTRDLLYVDVEDGASKDDFGPDAKNSMKKRWYATRPDIHFIDDNLRRIVREVDNGEYGYYWLLNPDGSKTKYAPTPFYNRDFGGSPPANAYRRWVPIEIHSATNRITTIQYKDRGKPLVQNEEPSWYPERIYEHGSTRYLKLTYEEIDYGPFSINNAGGSGIGGFLVY